MAESTGRFYEVDGKHLPSVTTILGKMLAKEALVPWAAKQTASAFRSAIEDCYAKGFGISDVIANLDSIEKESKAIYKKKSTEAMAKGTQVHDAIEQWINSNGTLQPKSFSDPVERHGIEQFLAWGEQHSIDIKAYEQQISTASYAGRFDLLAEIDGIMTLVDFKTSVAIYEPEMPLQLHAYAAALPEPPQHVAILRLDKDTADIEYRYWHYDLDMVTAFQSMATAFNILYPYTPPKRGRKEIV